MTVQWISVDNTTFEVRHARLLLPVVKQTPVRRFKYNTMVHNQIYLSNLILFEPRFSQIWHYLNRVIPEKLLTNHVGHLLTRLLSTLLAIDLPREVYRKNKALWFWMDRNFDLIKDCFASHRISIKINKCIYVLS